MTPQKGKPMKVRDIPTAEVLDDSEEFIDRYVLLVQQLIELERHQKGMGRNSYLLTMLLDEEL